MYFFNTFFTALFLFVLLAVPSNAQPVAIADALGERLFTQIEGPTKNEFGMVTVERLSKSFKQNGKTVDKQLEVLRAETVKTGHHVHELAVYFNITEALAQKETLLLSFHGRTLHSDDESGDGVVDISVSQKDSPYERIFSSERILPKQWKKFQIPFRSHHHKDWPAGTVGLSFRFATTPQTIEIANVRLERFGPEVDPKDLPQTDLDYEGREPDASWRKAAAERIDKHRKADLSVLVLDSEGNSIADAEVEINMTRHQFGWGSAIAAWCLTNGQPFGEPYRRFVEENYNRVVLEYDLKWPEWLMQDRRRMLFDSLNWFRDKNIEIRGHALLWPGWQWMPGFAHEFKDDPEKLQRTVLEHIADEAGSLSGRLRDWDVVNEPYSNRDLMNVLGDKSMVDWYRKAKESDPQAKMYINDFGILNYSGRDVHHQDHYEKTIRFLLENGAPLEGIGIQSHFSTPLTPPERIYRILDRFATFGLPITITEHDFGTDDEQLQADFTRDFLTIAFSHPAVEGILTWGFWEGHHFQPRAALVRKDWTLKPAGEVWLNLVKRDWWTHETLKTDKKGICQTRAFYGNYDIIARSGSKEKTVSFSLDKDGSKQIIIQF